MQTIHKIRSVIFLLSAMLFIQGCQDEVVEIVNPPEAEVITASSKISDLLQRTSSKDGSEDNIIDRNSCVSITYPVTIIIGDTEIVVSSEDDLDDIEDILEESDDDLEIVFPITVILPDYTEVTVANKDELDDLDDCDDDGEDLDIECVDIQFPVTVQAYDANNQLASVITIENERDLYELLESLEDDEYLTFEFPITVILWNGNEIEVSNQEDLEEIIEDVEDACDEDDDNDYDDDDVDDTRFIDVLTDGQWEVEKLLDDGEDYTSLFNGYVLSFANDGTFVLDNGEISLTGEWDTSGNSGEIELDIDLESDDLDELSDLEEINNDWEVKDFNENLIELVDDVNNNDDPEQLTFTKI